MEPDNRTGQWTWTYYIHIFANLNFRMKIVPSPTACQSSCNHLRQPTYFEYALKSCWNPLLTTAYASFSSFWAVVILPDQKSL